MPKEDEERKVKNQRCGQGEVTPLGGAQHAGLSTFPPLLPCWLALRTLISHYTHGGRNQGLMVTQTSGFLLLSAFSVTLLKLSV